MNKSIHSNLAQTLTKGQRNHLRKLTFARVLANGLDLLGLAGIALLGSAFGSIASGGGSSQPLTLPLVGEAAFTEFEALVLALGVVLTFLLKSGFSIWLNLRTAIKVAEIEVDLAERLTNNFFSEHSTEGHSLTETVSAFQNSILVATSQIAFYLNARLTAITEGSLLVLLLIVFSIVNPIATLSMLLYLSLVVLFLNRFVNARVRRNSRNVIEGSENSLRTSKDLFGVRREAKAGGTKELWLRRIVFERGRVATGKGLNYTMNSLPRYAIETALLVGIFGFLAAVIVFSDLASQAVTLGVFLAGGLRLLGSLLPLQAAYNGMVGSGEQSREAVATLQKISDRPVPKTFSDIEPSQLPNSLNLKFKDVTFGFPEAEKATLKAISFVADSNSKTAIVGPSGAGKTTLFELATGFRSPDSGEIEISGFSPRHLLEKTSGVIGIVPQRPHLVSGSLAENVSLEKEEATDLERVMECIEAVELGALVQNGTLGLRAQISPDAGFLSGGEIQRLGIARALYRNPKILFLDEATSSLDAETESKISNVLDSLKSQMTIVLIAHRLSTVQNADQILYLRGGVLVAQGSFSELKKQVPDFANAVRLLDLS